MLLALLFALAGHAATPAPSPDFQWKIVELFTNERCDLIRASTPKEMYPKLRPNVRAIVAFCEPRDADPEQLFASAEHDDPSGDLILVLHAKWAWKRDHEKALPLWDKVLKTARNESLRSMAKRYLADEVEEDETLHLSALSYLIKARTGGGYESNPVPPLAPQSAEKHPQAFTSLALGGGAQLWRAFGSISANLDSSYRRYLATPALSLFQSQLETPVSLRLGTYEDLVLRPFFAITYKGSREYGQRFGLGVMGVAYRPDYKQYVQGSVFSERLYDPLVTPEEGTHFRFDYNWELFPGQWIHRFQAVMEHVHAVNDFNNGTNLKFSHTDVGVAYRALYLQHGISYEGEARGTMRLDSLPSGYNSPASGARMSDRRNDFTLVVRPAVTVPLGREVALNASYELRRTWSPMVYPSDYADYNIVDHKGELLLTTEFSNY